ncbi:alpha-2-macroglobulin family protein, partial [Pedobacter sp.]|uniref:alpha-2-macroglobulin family protein n=1 Tax=Pedobacter sp. TaxID=1411316 RepID=UPI003D7F1FB8
PSSIRKNFADDAFWQPKLRTNAQGRVKFKVTFPDDITNWRTFFIAMNGKSQSGYTDGNIKAFKPLSAAFVSPLFAIEGDTFSPLGKIANYGATAVSLKRSFKYNEKTLLEGVLSVENSHLDTLTVKAEGADSLKFNYSIQKESGYADREERTIPLFKAGILETKGVFYALEKDTAIALTFDQKLGEVSFRAEASVLPVLENETEYLRNYEYFCNEQLASKLKALLVQKRIKTFQKETFNNERVVKQIIRQLEDGRRKDGTWGWWKNSDAELWISRHAIEALLDAEKSGFQVKLNKEELRNYLVYQLASFQGMNKLEALLLLQKINAKVDYKGAIALYESELKKAKAKVSVQEKFKLLNLKQQNGMAFSTDSLLPFRHSTLFGNLYFGKNSFHLFDNSIQNTLLAYQMVRTEGKHADWLLKMRNYLLEQRQDGHWRNTYESSLILETLLPDLLKEGEQLKATTLTITSGNNKEVISQFPYTHTFAAGETVNLQKQGTLPLYMTASQQFWNAQPEKVSKEFTVATWFENSNGAKVKALKGGTAIMLKATVKVSADADYVMVEIPIPAGCSYEEKEQSWWGQEEHRAYGKNKVSIFCRKLKVGDYTFSIKLMPRYDGNYTLNPAKAELMYFPVFYGREALKKVQIGN